MTEPLILASGSRFRQKMLGDAGVAFDVILPDLDERALGVGVRLLVNLVENSASVP